MPGRKSVLCSKKLRRSLYNRAGAPLGTYIGPCPTGDQRSMCDENYDLLISIPMIGAGASWSRNGLSQVAAAECVRHEKPSGSTAGGIEPGKNMLESSL